MKRDRSLQYLPRLAGVLPMAVAAAVSATPVAADESVTSDRIVVALADAPPGSTTTAKDFAGAGPGVAGARAAWAQGPEALRRYLHRTRMIWNLYYWDFARPD